MKTELKTRTERDALIVDAAIEHYLKSGEGVRVADLMKATGYSSGVVYRALQAVLGSVLQQRIEHERTQSRDYAMFEMGMTRRAYYFPTRAKLRSMLLAARGPEISVTTSTDPTQPMRVETSGIMVCKNNLTTEEENE